ncbi:MAG: chemotaxis protein CheD [Planctomycetes bacterium]|nr:chemotaxis protein CheD [Planctomycetota bacterium]
MDTIVDVNTGEVKVGRKMHLRSLAIGSCIVVAAYDAETRVGGMAHIMLPKKAPKKSLNKTRYASDAIDELLRQMIEEGVSPENIEVSLVGAGNVLQKKDQTICDSNIQSTTQLLKENNLPAKASVLGGINRKSVFMDTEKGRVSYTEGDGPQTLLWQAAKR